MCFVCGTAFFFCLFVLGAKFRLQSRPVLRGLLAGAERERRGDTGHGRRPSVRSHRGHKGTSQMYSGMDSRPINLLL